jgi:hypothetical protein
LIVFRVRFDLSCAGMYHPGAKEAHDLFQQACELLGTNDPTPKMAPKNWVAEVQPEPVQRKPAQPEPEPVQRERAQPEPGQPPPEPVRVLPFQCECSHDESVLLESSVFTIKTTDLVLMNTEETAKVIPGP